MTKTAVAAAMAATFPKPAKSWSFSRLLDFERCPYKYRLKHVDKVPEPENPYAARGVELHGAHEDFITGKRTDIHPELNGFSAEMKSMRERFAAGSAVVEEEWAFDRKWQPCNWRDWDTVYTRIKLDCFIHLSDEVGCVVDGKTGKKYGNEIKHAEQGQLYAGSAFLKYPTKQKIIVEFHYWDQADKPEDRITQVEYNPRFAAKALVAFERRADKVLQATTFPPRPNILNCRYCSYGKHKGNGACKASA